MNFFKNSVRLFPVCPPLLLQSDSYSYPFQKEEPADLENISFIMTKIRQLLSRGGMLRNVNSFYRFAAAPFECPLDSFMKRSRFSMPRSCHCSRSARLRQTWHTHPRQRPLQGLLPFQVCTVATDLAHSPSSEAAPGPVTVPGLRGFDRPGTLATD